jgi:hypothetical protein
LLWRTGDIAGALREFEKAREEFPKIDARRTPDVLVVATQYRNALRLESKQRARWAPADEARDLLERCLAQGYGFPATDTQFATQIPANAKTPVFDGYNPVLLDREQEARHERMAPPETLRRSVTSRTESKWPSSFAPVNRQRSLRAFDLLAVQKSLPRTRMSFMADGGLD